MKIYAHFSRFLDVQLEQIFFNLVPNGSQLVNVQPLNRANSTVWRFCVKNIAKMFVYKHYFCYLNVQIVKQKNSLFHQPIVLWLAY